MTKRKNTKGQAMTEYIIIVVLCAIGLLTVVTFFGNDIKQMFYAASSGVRNGKQVKVAYPDKVTDVEHGKADSGHSTKLDDLEK